MKLCKDPKRMFVEEYFYFFILIKEKFVVNYINRNKGMRFMFKQDEIYIYIYYWNQIFLQVRRPILYYYIDKNIQNRKSYAKVLITFSALMRIYTVIAIIIYNPINNEFLHLKVQVMKENIPNSCTITKIYHITWSRCWSAARRVFWKTLYSIISPLSHDFFF